MGAATIRETARHLLSHDAGPFWQFVKYGAVGVFATCVQMTVFYVLAVTCLKCLTADDWAVVHMGLPSVAFSGEEPWYAARWFLAAAATAVGFVVANMFCWLLNRAIVFRPGKFAWYTELALFFCASSFATLVALAVQSVLIRHFDVTTSFAVVVEVAVSFVVNFCARKFFIFRG